MKRNGMIGIILFVALIVVPPGANLGAETTSSLTEYSQALGFSGGGILGPGLTWTWWPHRTGVQVCAGIVYIPPESNEFWDDRTLDYSAAVQLTRSVFADTYTTWFAGQLYLWTSTKHRGYIPVEWSDDDDDEYEVGDFIATASLGAGIGIELVLFEHFSIPFDFGYIGTAEFLGDDAIPLAIEFAFQGGLRYRY